MNFDEFLVIFYYKLLKETEVNKTTASEKWKKLVLFTFGSMLLFRILFDILLAMADTIDLTGD